MLVLCECCGDHAIRLATGSGHFVFIISTLCDMYSIILILLHSLTHFTLTIDDLYFEVNKSELSKKVR